METSILRCLLNEYLSGVANVVFAHSGTIAKILSDKMHLLLGVPDDQPDHANRAIARAWALDEYGGYYAAAGNKRK
jgi:adenylate cyclase